MIPVTGMSLALGLATLLQQCQDAGAWGEAGHERLNEVAQRLLHGKHRDQIRTMMHSDVAAAASWEKVMTSKYPETEKLHWHHQKSEWTCGQRDAQKTEHIRCNGKGAEDGSMFCALAFFFSHFADEMLLKEYPEPKVPIDTPKKIPAFDKVNVDDLADGQPRKNARAAFYLRWLTTLVGDLHQPLHWLAENSFGADVKIVYQGEEHSLLSFWEEHLPKKLPEIPSMTMLDLEYKAQYHQWGHRLPPELFRQWAGEMADKVCNEIYGPMYVNHADGSRKIESPFQLSEELFSNWVKLADQMIQEGGERLALVFLDIIEHRRHKAAQKEGRGLPPPLLAASVPAASVAEGGKSANSIPAPVKGSKGSASGQAKLLYGLHRARRQRAWRNLTINLIIAAVVVPALLFGLHLHSRSPGNLARMFALGKHEHM
ncbi:nucS [Symbiodinium sp. CCMP2456]|nr:nucS [Symbiodinium sp. CCMP2456]